MGPRHGTKCLLRERGQGRLGCRVSNRSHDDGGRDRGSCFGDREEPGSRNSEKYKDKDSLRGSRTVREEICCQSMSL